MCLCVSILPWAVTVQMIEEFCFLSPVASLNKPDTVKDAHDDSSLEISVIVCCLFADYL